MPKLNDTSNFKLQVENLALRKEIEKLTEVIASLNSKLSHTTPNAPIISNDSNISDEEIIAISELKKLQDRSSSGKELTLEEIKKYDILVKNKRLVQNQEDSTQKDNLPDLQDDNLILIATSKLEKK